MEGPLIGLFCLAIPPTALAICAYIFFHHATREPKSTPLSTIFAPSARPPTILEEDEDSSSPVVEPSPRYPEDWNSSDRVFSVERRAIFSKQWLFITHRSRFSRPGDYHTFQIAGFPIFLILGKDHVIRAFHNVCRHRAYVVVKKKSGSSTVLGCRYHGWSYDTRGCLVKAPAFEDMKNFDKSKNSLFALHTLTTKQGFVFINLSSEARDSSPKFAETDVLASAWRISERSAPLTQFEFQADLNWKEAADYFEQIGHTGMTLPSHGWKTFFISKIPLLWKGVHPPGDAPAILDSHGLSTLHVSHGGRLWYTLSANPSSARQTVFRCDIYLNWPGDNPQGDAAIHRIQHSVQAHVDAAAKATRPEWQRHPGLQASILDGLTHHLRAERKAGKEIWPASRESGASERFNQADMLCKQFKYLKSNASEMDPFGQTGQRNVLEW
ncbi:Rieske [2Fe-2S] iron-sulfur domain-containing protein [Phyllosticta citrichinensis]|uniref:Rieske [2Fe-2S] iron-sulfur domain-containing protein n=1 Tax=Phyllosticta citrichinensis TaxID=1130410 RepID=A0ABR1Y7Z1_9PEZI